MWTLVWIVIILHERMMLHMHPLVPMVLNIPMLLADDFDFSRDLHELVSLSTFFKKKYYGTWQHPRNKLQHQLDHIFIFKPDIRWSTNCESCAFGQLIDNDHIYPIGEMMSFSTPFCKVYISISIDSDHRSVRCSIRFLVNLQRKTWSSHSTIPTRLYPIFRSGHKNQICRHNYFVPLKNIPCRRVLRSSFPFTFYGSNFYTSNTKPCSPSMVCCKRS